MWRILVKRLGRKTVVRFLIIIITFILLQMLSYYISNSGNNTLWLVRIMKHKISTIWIIFFSALFITAMSEVLAKLDEKYTTELTKYEKQIEKNSGLIEAKYGEFAESISDKNIKKILEKTVKKFPMVEACHLYFYEFHRVKDSIDIKINFYQGYEQEMACINVIKQNYYSINKVVFQAIDELNNDIDRKTENYVINKVLDIYNMIEKSDMHQSIKKRLFEVLFYLLCKKLNYNNIGYKEDDNNKLDTFRTGIIGCLLLEQGYIYKYKKNNENKKGRVYFATPLVLNSEYILNIIIDGRDLNRTEMIDLFTDVVIFIKKEYNNIIGGAKLEK